jgi:hypothetical protein
MPPKLTACAATSMMLHPPSATARCSLCILGRIDESVSLPLRISSPVKRLSTTMEINQLTFGGEKRYVFRYRHRNLIWQTVLFSLTELTLGLSGLTGRQRYLIIISNFCRATNFHAKSNFCQIKSDRKVHTESMNYCQNGPLIFYTKWPHGPWTIVKFRCLFWFGSVLTRYLIEVW